MQTSLGNLVNNINPKEFCNTKKYFNDIELLTRKVVYPYDYANLIDKFNETKLPPIQEFYCKLNNDYKLDPAYFFFITWVVLGCL